MREKAGRELISAASVNGYWFRPVIDKNLTRPLLRDYPRKLYERGDFVRVPLLAGLVRNEGTLDYYSRYHQVKRLANSGSTLLSIEELIKPYVRRYTNTKVLAAAIDYNYIQKYNHSAGNSINNLGFRQNTYPNNGVNNQMNFQAPFAFNFDDTLANVSLLHLPARSSPCRISPLEISFNAPLKLDRSCKVTINCNTHSYLPFSDPWWLFVQCAYGPDVENALKIRSSHIFVRSYISRLKVFRSTAKDFSTRSNARFLWRNSLWWHLLHFPHRIPASRFGCHRKNGFRRTDQMYIFFHKPFTGWIRLQLSCSVYWCWSFLLKFWSLGTTITFHKESWSTRHDVLERNDPQFRRVYCDSLPLLSL